MDDDEVDAGQFEPIAQMRRLAVVLPKALEPVDQIPVKLCLPDALDPDLFSELLTEQEDPTSKHESVKKEKDLPMKVTKSNPDKHETKETKDWEEKEREKKESEKIGSSKKESEKKETEKKESEKKEQQKSGREKKESERKEMEKNARETKEAEKKGSSKKESEKKEAERKESEKKEEEKIAREKKELERKEKEKNATETKEREKIDTDKKDYEKSEHERKETILKNRRDDIRSKETSGKQNYWSESEMSSVSIASQLSLRPGRNMRATPLSRASSRNTNYDDLHFEVDPNETFSRRARKVSPMEGSESSYRHAQKRVKDRDLVDQLVDGRRREHRKEVHRYYVKSMINDAYKRKRNGIAGFSSDLDHPSPHRGRLPTEPRSHSTLSHRNIHSGHAHNEPKHHHHHRSKRSDAAAAYRQSKHHGNGDAGRRSADWVRSQQVGRRVQSAEPLTSVKGSDEVENVILIIKEEFKRLGFL